MSAEEGAAMLITATKKALRRNVSKEARAVGKKTIESAEKLLEAAKVKPIAGRLPVNHRYAGKAMPASKLPKRYRKKGCASPRTATPILGSMRKPCQTASDRQVKINFSGNRTTDELAANKAAGYKPAKTPEGNSWHHHQDGTTMMLVPRDLHRRVKHTGGFAHYRHATGDTHAYP
jgi:hypothetical protein